MDAERFRFLCEDYGELERPGGIGVMGEKGVHAVLKRYYQPQVGGQEIRVGRFVADAVTGDGCVVEVQTGSFAPMRKKLAAFLERYEVVVVHPAYRTRWVRTVDPATGELSPRRRCGRPETPWKLFYQLSSIREFLGRPNLHFRVPVLEVQELRRKGDRRGARYECIPSALLEEAVFQTTRDFLTLLPPGLPAPFTCAEAARAAGVPAEDVRMGLYMMNLLGLVQRTGRRGSAYLYQLPPAE